MPTTFQWIIVAIIIIIIFIFVKLRYIKHKLTWIIILILIFLFYIGFLVSGAGKNINLQSFEGNQAAIKMYLSWLGKSLQNVKTLAGNVIKLDWSGNSTS